MSGLRAVDAVLVFERAVRELDVATALAAVLSRRHGLTLEIVHQEYPPRRLFESIRPAVLVVPYSYSERSNSAFVMAWRDAAIFSLNWEQLFYAGVASAKTPRGEFATRHVIHNAWSDGFAAHLRANGVPEEHIAVCGHPAYALYDEPYRRYFRSRADLASAWGLDPGRRWLFFPENYNWAFYGQAMVRQMVGDGQPADQVERMREAVTRSFQTVMRWCAMAARRGGVEVVIRPRPTTLLDEFTARVRDVLGEIPPGLTITKGETVREWVLASDIVMSSYSTSLIEASIAGKPAFMVEPEPWPESLHVPWHDFVPRLRTEAELLAAAAGTSAGTAPGAAAGTGADPGRAGSAVAGGELGAWARATLLAHGDPILRIADQIAAIRSRAVPLPSPPPWRSITLANRHHLPDRAAYLYRRFVHPRIRDRAHADLPWERVAPGHREDVAAWRDVPQRIARWGPILEEHLARAPASALARPAPPTAPGGAEPPGRATTTER